MGTTPAGSDDLCMKGRTRPKGKQEGEKTCYQIPFFHAHHAEGSPEKIRGGVAVSLPRLCPAVLRRYAPGNLSSSGLLWARLRCRRLRRSCTLLRIDRRRSSSIC